MEKKDRRDTRERIDRFHLFAAVNEIFVHSSLYIFLDPCQSAEGINKPPRTETPVSPIIIHYAAACSRNFRAVIKHPYAGTRTMGNVSRASYDIILISMFRWITFDGNDLSRRYKVDNFSRFNNETINNVINNNT